MKIAAANLSMQSQHMSAVREETRETLRAWVGPQRPDFEGRQSAASVAPLVQISDAGRAAQSSEAADGIQSAMDAANNDPKLALIMAVVEMLTGHAVRIFDARELQQANPAAVDVPAPNQNPAAPAAGFGIEYDRRTVRDEAEQTSFSANGVVRTADGQEITFRLDLSMARQYHEESNFSLRAGDAQRKDPLVINFDGTAAQLTDQRFQFDLNTDGKAENLPMLAAGSGYLALDLNANGRIDSGSELFGPKTGSGFAELARYDQDGNGWIDEADAAYQQLKVWTPTAEGSGDLSSVKALGVGALYLGRVDTPFELRGQGNRDLGAVAASSLYLKESGEAGTVQEIDLTA